MVWEVKIVTTYEKSDQRFSDRQKIVGRDLGHALEQLPIPESARRELGNKGETKLIDSVGRKKTYKIMGQIKA